MRDSCLRKLEIAVNFMPIRLEFMLDLYGIKNRKRVFSKPYCLPTRGENRDESRTEKALHIDDAIVLLVAKAFYEFEQLGPFALLLVVGVNLVDEGMALKKTFIAYAD